MPFYFVCIVTRRRATNQCCFFFFLYFISLCFSFYLFVYCDQKKKGYQQTPRVGPFAGVEPWVYFNVGGDHVKKMLEEVRLCQQPYREGGEEGVTNFLPDVKYEV